MMPLLPGWPSWTLASVIGGMGLISYALLRARRRETLLQKKRRVRRKRNERLALKQARGVHDIALIRVVFARGGDEAAEAYIAARNVGRPRAKQLRWIRDGKT